MTDPRPPYFAVWGCHGPSNSPARNHKTPHDTTLRRLRCLTSRAKPPRSALGAAPDPGARPRRDGEVGRCPALPPGERTKPSAHRSSRGARVLSCDQIPATAVLQPASRPVVHNDFHLLNDGKKLLSFECLTYLLIREQSGMNRLDPAGNRARSRDPPTPR